VSGVRLLLTHGTATGREPVARCCAPAMPRLWLPYDTPGAVRRFLRRHRPAVGVLMETEIWPNLLLATREAACADGAGQCPAVERSLAKGRRLQALLRPTLPALTRTLAQTEADAHRLRDSGVVAVQVMPAT
jgi:3-deoxy-D-manno-octulosonic-acid transferase